MGRHDGHHDDDEVVLIFGLSTLFRVQSRYLRFDVATNSGLKLVLFFEKSCSHVKLKMVISMKASNKKKLSISKAIQNG